jgi:peptidoglycan/xylan/chitin deacetylase (PgdA/CDA1 family)
MRRFAGVALALLLPGLALAAPVCPPAKRLYLTIDTGSMRDGEHIAEVLNKRGVKATFFLANEKTVKGDKSLDDGWAPFWKARVAEGHAFGSHTLRHWYLREDRPDGTIRYQGKGKGQVEYLTQAAFCAELKAPAERLKAMTGATMSPLWRAPGGKTTPRALEWAKTCGFPEHVGWSSAGFLGDELPSDKYPNKLLLERALANIKGGDILLMHTGIWSRAENFTEILDPLIAGLQKKGFCFATLLERPGATPQRPAS